MTYRLHEHKPPKPQRTAVDITTPVKLYMHNGTLSNFAFPCWYQEVLPPVPAIRHDRELHDHHGWPNPSHPDHICQLWIPEKGHCIHGFSECKPHCKHFIDYKKVHPIHLLSEYEGYESVTVGWVDDHEGIEATAYIDEVEDWVVRLQINCQDPNALEELQRYRLAVYAYANTNDENHPERERKDLVVLAELIVLPAGYYLTDPQ